MKKIFTTIALSVAAVAFAAQAQEFSAYDFAGRYVCTAVEGIEGTVDDFNAECVGNVMTVRIGSAWSTPIEVMVDNLIPITSGTKTFYGELNVDNKTMMMYSKRCTAFEGTRLSTTDPDAQDLDRDQADYINNIPAGRADGFKDLIINYNEDLSVITVDNLALLKLKGKTPVLTITKLVYERAQIPATPQIYAEFSVADGVNNITVTAPTQLSSECNYAPINGNMAITLERSTDWGSNWTEVKTWADVAPGTEVTYTDADLDFLGDSKIYYYRAKAVLNGVDGDYNQYSTQIGKNAPDVTNLKAVTDAGNPPVVITFNLPSAAELELPLDKVEICRTNLGEWEATPIYIITDELTPEREITYADNDVVEGNNYQYQVYTYWKYGKSYGDGVRVFVGKDVPGYAENIKATAVGQKITVTWDAPTTGLNSGYFDPSTTRYMVTRHLSNDNYDYAVGGFASTVVLTPDEGITATSIEDVVDATEPTEYTYTVYTFAEGTEKAESGQATVIAGPDYSLPFVENFDATEPWGSKKPEKMWNTTGYINYTSTVYFGWGWEGVSAPDNSGMCDFSSSNFWPGAVVDHTSFGIDFSNASCPVAITTYLTYNYDATSTLSVQAGKATDAVSDFTTYAVYSPVDLEIASADGAHACQWTTVAVAMPELAGVESAKVNLQFCAGDVTDYDNKFIVDKFSIVDYPVVRDLTASLNEADKSYTLTWNAPEAEDLNIVRYDVYRTATQKTENIATGETTETGATGMVQIARLGVYTTSYSDSMVIDDNTLDVTKHTYCVKAVYSSPDVEVPAYAEVDKVPSAIDSVGVDANMPAVYYNVQGQRISNPVKGQMYIKVQNGKAVKVVF